MHAISWQRFSCVLVASKICYPYQFRLGSTSQRCFVSDVQLMLCAVREFMKFCVMNSNLGDQQGWLLASIMLPPKRMYNNR
ncbi:hypothetical protein Y032_0023g808 [Ancylostoma ceylanicum]|nr:hypothetical protein Y032_0023g808 [Ancylostoma ceylanicum]